MPNCGCGLTAKLQEKGGSDIICVSPTSWWRMKCCGSLAAFLPYCDCSKIIRDLTPEINATVKEAPVISLSGPHNPLLPPEKLLDEIWSLGLSGINPVMAHLYDPPFNEQISSIGMGFDLEVEVVKLARKRDIFSFAYAYTVEDARIFAAAGADVVAGHVGATAAERLPIEVAVLEATRSYKEYRRG
jgi:predicted TIM-barrel enzyme